MSDMSVYYVSPHLEAQSCPSSPLMKPKAATDGAGDHRPSLAQQVCRVDRKKKTPRRRCRPSPKKTMQTGDPPLFRPPQKPRRLDTRHDRQYSRLESVAGVAQVRADGNSILGAPNLNSRDNRSTRSPSRNGGAVVSRRRQRQNPGDSPKPEDFSQVTRPK